MHSKCLQWMSHRVLLSHIYFQGSLPQLDHETFRVLSSRRTSERYHPKPCKQHERRQYFGFSAVLVSCSGFGSVSIGAFAVIVHQGYDIARSATFMCLTIPSAEELRVRNLVAWGWL